MSGVQIGSLSKAYGTTPVLHEIDLTIVEGAVTAVLGASGSGKTTLLRVIAGFENADSGTVSIGGTLVDDGRRTIRPQHRSVGYVPQDAALFPHLTVAANIGFGVPRRARAGLADIIELVGLTGYEKRSPHELSGGQQQRVALARALAINPQVVLLDEPFGSLDAALRETVRADVGRILTQAGTTTLLVTHDQDEALSLADHIALLHDGRVLAYGDPRQLYLHPPTPQVAAAIGIANVLPATIANQQLQCGLGTLTAMDPATLPHEGHCSVLLRPEQIIISTDTLRTGDIRHSQSLHQDSRPDIATDPQLAPAPARGLPATIQQLRYHGHDTLLDLICPQTSGLHLVARLAGGTDLKAGDQVRLRIDSPVHTWPQAVASSTPGAQPTQL